MNLGGWYKSDSLSENLRTVIPRVILVQESEPNSSDSKYNYKHQIFMSILKTSNLNIIFLYNVISSKENVDNI